MSGRARASDRIQLAIARRLIRLGPRWQRLLASRVPAQLDGLTLDPQLRLLLALRERRRFAPLPSLTPQAARLRTSSEAAAAGGPPIPVARVADITVDGAAGPLRARHYVPAHTETPPLLLFLHGGGFVICDLDTHDQACRLLCRQAGVQVLSVDYRLAPEHPFPAAVEDSWAALRWAFEHAGDLGADPERVAVAGDSAGGNLAAVLAQLAAAQGGPAPALQVLIYPAVDRGGRYPSLDLFASGFFLTRDEIDWFHRHYSTGVDREDPRLNPRRAKDLSGLAPALVVTAGFDPLRDEGEAYAEAMAAAGTHVRLRRMPDMIHGFINMIDLSSTARAALVEIADDVRSMLAASHMR